MEWRCSCSCFALSYLVCCWNEERGASFYRWRGGALWIMPHPLMKSVNQPQDTLNLAGHLRNHHCNVSGKRPTKKWAKRGRTSGVAAPPLSPNAPIFGERAPLGFSTWPMLVFCKDKVIWFGFWPYSPLCLGPDLSGNGPRSFGLV